MGKTMIVFRYLLLLFLIVLNINTYSQELFSKELLWVDQDSIETLVFIDTNQIMDWAKNQLPFSMVYSKDVIVEGTNVFVLMISGCSGIPCWKIYVFKKIEETWHLIAKTNARLKEQIKTDADLSQKKIIFITKSGQIGELPFDILLEKGIK